MRRNGKRRLEKYDANTDSDVLKKYIDNLKPLMLRSQSIYFNEMAIIEDKTKQLLESVGTPVYQIPNYLFFAREIYRIHRKFKLGTLSSSGQERLVKWVSRGLDEALLIKIAGLQGVTLFEIPKIVLTGDAIPQDVRISKTFYNTNPNIKETGLADLLNHQNAENYVVGNSSLASQTAWRIQFAAGATILSKAITISRRCLIIVVTTHVKGGVTVVTQIRRGADNITAESNLSNVNFAIAGCYGILQYAYEVLNAGTYTYTLVNSSGSAVYFYGTNMKIVAIAFG